MKYVNPDVAEGRIFCSVYFIAFKNRFIVIFKLMIDVSQKNVIMVPNIIKQKLGDLLFLPRI